MPNPVTISVGVVTTAVKTGLNSLKGQFKSLREFANGQLAGALVGGGLIATLTEIVDKAGKIQDAAQRFGVVPEELQKITNAAAPNGAAMEDVASALNKTAINQEKVRKGDEKLRSSLKDLGISAAEFINLSPEEAFYKISDAVKDTEDRSAAYGAVVDLMGKKAGVLFTTIEQGSKVIKEQGEAVGVMSNDTVTRLDDVGDTFANAKNSIMVYGGEAVAFLVKCVQSIGALIGTTIVEVSHLLGATGDLMSSTLSGNFKKAADDWKNLKNELAGGAGSMQEQDEKDFAQAKEDIWHPKNDDAADGKPKKNRDLDDLESEKANAEKLGEMYEKLDEKKEKMAQDQLKGEAKINDLINERDALYQNASFTDDLQEQAKMWDKALDVEKEIMTLREQADKEAEERMDKTAKKREQWENKILDMGMENMTDEQKIAALSERREQAYQKAAGQDDEEKRLDDLMEALGYEEKIAAIKKAGDKREIVAEHITKIGGGGVAYIAAKDPLTERATKAAEASNKLLGTANETLKLIKDKIGDARWSS